MAEKELRTDAEICKEIKREMLAAYHAAIMPILIKWENTGFIINHGIARDVAGDLTPSVTVLINPEKRRYD